MYRRKELARKEGKGDKGRKKGRKTKEEGMKKGRKGDEKKRGARGKISEKCKGERKLREKNEREIKGEEREGKGKR